MCSSDLLKMRANLKKGAAMEAVTQRSYQREAKDENWLWHLISRHLNFGALNLLHRKGMVKGLPLIEKPDNVCKGFILGGNIMFLVIFTYAMHCLLGGLSMMVHTLSSKNTL